MSLLTVRFDGPQDQWGITHDDESFTPLTPAQVSQLDACSHLAPVMTMGDGSLLCQDKTILPDGSGYGPYKITPDGKVRHY